MAKAKTHKQATSDTIEAATIAASSVNKDLLLSVFIVSAVINLFVLTAWVTLQVTTMYDSQIASFLFVR